MRVRISTTVDQERLNEARARSGDRDSELMDRALAALLDALDAEAELRALEVAPYALDPELAMPDAGAGADDYDGVVPSNIMRLAKRRRAARSSQSR